MSIFGDVLGFIGGKGLASNLARVAILGFASRLLNKNTTSGSAQEGGAADIVDPGVRVQLDPSTDNRIPVLYGESYFGGYITDAVLSADYTKMNFCITLAEATGDLLSTGAGSAYTFKNLYFGTNRVVFKADGITVDYTLDPAGNQDIKFRDLVKVYFYKGQTGIAPEGSSEVIPGSSTVMPGWTVGTHPMTDLLYAVVEITYSRSAGVTGLPDCVFQIDNTMTLPGDVLNDYMKNTRYGAGIPAADIDTSLADLNTFCSAGFSYTDAASVVQTGTIDINGLVDTGTNVLDNMKGLAEAGSAWMSYNVHEGKWSAIINKTGTSIASITDSHILGEISVGGTSLTQLFNAADVQFSNTDILDKTDFAKISLPSGELFQNEVANTMQLKLPFTNKQNVAIKIGAQSLKQARVDKIISFVTDYSFINIKAGEIIDITSSVFGYTNKEFRVISVEETEEDDGTISIKFECLEYLSTVYDFAVQEVDIVTDDGFLSVGAIGTPDIPIVQKVQQSNVPRINISADTPSGIVDQIEFWLTFDTTVGNDADRTYERIGSVGNPDGSLLTENQTVTFRFAGLNQSDFLVKVRGVNNLTSGPFSTPTGVIAFTPEVVADTVSDSPVAGIGGSLMTLGLLTLLNNVDDLLALANGEKGIFDTITDILFPSRADGVTDAADILAADPAFISAVGTQTTNVGNYSIDALSDVDTVTNQTSNTGDVLAWNGTNWVPTDISSCCDVASKVPAEPETPPGPTQCYLTIANLYPADRTTWEPAVQALPDDNPDQAPTTGSYFIVYTDSQQGFYGPLTVGSGNVKLYKSDGTLVETLAAASCTITDRILELPFGARDPKTDYFIVMDEGVVEHCDCISPEIEVATWNFSTPHYKVDAFAVGDISGGLLDYVWSDLTLGVNLTGEVCKPGAVLTVTFSETPVAGSGSITIEDGVGVAGTYSFASGTLDGNAISWPVGTDLDFGQSYTVEIPAGFASTSRSDVVLCDATIPAAADVTNASASAAFSTTARLDLSSYTLFKYVNPAYPTESKTDISPQSEIKLVWNNPVSLATSAKYVKIFKLDGTLHQSINVSTSYATEFTNEIIRVVNSNEVWINPTTDMEVGADYYLTIDQGAFEDSCTSTNNAITGTGTIFWSMAGGVTIGATTPGSGEAQNINETGIEMEFGDEIESGYGQLLVKDGTGATVATIDSDDSAITYSSA